MKNQSEILDLEKNLPLVWGELIAQGDMALAIMSLLIGYMSADKNRNEHSKDHYKKLLKGTVDRFYGVNAEELEKINRCSFCSKKDIKLIAGAEGFICLDCTNIALEQFNNDK